MLSLRWIELLIFQKGMHMLNSRQELMLRRRNCTWMVVKLMEMLLKPSSRYLRARKYLHPLNLFQVYQREMLRELIMLALTMRKMGLSAQGKLLRHGSLYHLQDGVHLCQGGVVLLEDYLILLLGEGWSLLSVVEVNLPTVVVIHHPDAGQHPHLEGVLHLLLPGGLGLLPVGAPPEGYAAVLFEDVLLFLQGAGHLLGESAVLLEDLRSAGVAGRPFVDLLVLVLGQSHPGGGEVQLGDVGGHLPTLVRPVPAGLPGGYQGAAVLGGP